MKKCPQCQSVYPDETLSFCLNDGVMLIFDSDNSEKTWQMKADAVTEVIPNQTDSNVQTPPISQPMIERTGVSPAWIYSTLGLLLLFIFGGIGTWVWLYNSANNLKTEINVKTVTVISPSPPVETQVNGQNSPTVQPTLPATQNPTPSLTTSPKEKVLPSPSPTQTPAEISYRVVGVASHDVLYLRPGPGDLKSYLAKIPPFTTGLNVVGGGVKSGKSVWYPVIYNGTRGWVNGKFIAKQ